MTENKHQYWTIRQVRKFFQVSRRTVLKWIENGDIKAVKLPTRQWRVEKDSVLALASQMPPENL